MEDFGDIMCEVYEDQNFVENQTSSNKSAYCSITFKVVFTIVPCDDDDNCMLSEAYETDEEEHTRIVGIDDLTSSDKDSPSVLVKILEGMQVTPAQIVIDKIKDCARQIMKNSDKYKNSKKKVFGMMVDLNVPREDAR